MANDSAILRTTPFVAIYVAATIATGGCAPGNRDSESNLAKGQEYAKRGEYDDAIACFTEVIDLEPRNAEAYFWRGTAFLMDGAHDDALHDFDRSIAIDPDEARTFCNRGEAWRLKGDNKKALADYDESLKLKPLYGSALLNRAMVFAAMGDDRKAIDDFTALLSIAPKDLDALYHRGNSYGHVGLLDKAIEDLTSAIEIVEADPTSVDWTKQEIAHLYFHRGMWRVERSEFANAIQDFRETTKADPSYHWAFMRMAQLYTRSSPDIEDANLALRNARRACELSKWTVSSQLATLSNANLSAGKLDEAIRWQREAISVASEGFDVDKAQRWLESLKRKAKISESDFGDLL